MDGLRGSAEVARMISRARASSMSTRRPRGTSISPKALLEVSGISGNCNRVSAELVDRYGNSGRRGELVRKV